MEDRKKSNEALIELEWGSGLLCHVLLGSVNRSSESIEGTKLIFKQMFLMER
jgi:hypothetical protein